MGSLYEYITLVSLENQDKNLIKNMNSLPAAEKLQTRGFTSLELDLIPTQQFMC